MRKYKVVNTDQEVVFITNSLEEAIQKVEDMANNSKLCKVMQRENQVY